MIKGTLEANETEREQWEEKFINLIGYVVDKDNKMPIFTPDHKFISQDTSHLTQAGAKYYAWILEEDKEFILNKIID
jgi:hypothetical protein